MAATSFTNLVKSWINAEGLVHILGKVALVFAIYGAAILAAELRSSLAFEVDPLLISDIASEAAEGGQVPFESYHVVKQRNIFGVKSKNKAGSEKKTPPKELKLRLVATNSSPGTEPFAIIEDLTKKRQSIFDLNDDVFEKGTLVEVLVSSVKLDVSGRIEELVLERPKSSGRSGKGRTSSTSSGSPSGQDFSVSEKELSDALADLPRLLSQARAVPYFRNGKSIGMRLFAIRRGSMYEKLGMKNGDILKTVNDNNLSDPSQALKLFEQLKDERSIHVLVERAGEDVDLRYAIE